MYNNLNLTRFQSDFINSFFNTNTKMNHLLFAPTGSGKTLVVAKIIENLYTKKTKKFLVLTSSKSMVEQYKMIFDQYIPEAIPMALSIKSFREYEAIKIKDENLQPNIIISTWESVFVESPKQMIMSTEWDLIAVDSRMSSTTSKRAKFLGKIVSLAESNHVLIISDPMSGENIKNIIGDNINTFKVTKWSLEKLYSGIKQISPILIRIYEYRRSDQEIDFINCYLDLSKKLPGKTFGNILREKLVASSLFAAEDSLRRSRNRLFHYREDDIDNGEADDLQGISEYQNASHLDNDQISATNDSEIESELSVLLSKAFSSLEKIQVDSKFDALQTFLEKNKESNSKMWIYSKYQSTIKYLSTSLKENFPNIISIHGGMPTSYINEAISRFNNDGGLLISSEVRLKGLHINSNLIFFYDSPSNQRQLYVILSRALSLKNKGSESPLELIMLKDLSETLYFEKENIQFIQHSLLSNLSSEVLS